MRIEKQADGTEMRLAVSGDLTLASAGQLRGELLDCVQGEDRPAVLDLEQVTEADMACLQVLLAAERTFAAKNRSLRFRHGECVGRLWSAAGYRRKEVPNGEDHHDGR